MKSILLTSTALVAFAGAAAADGHASISYGLTGKLGYNTGDVAASNGAYWEGNLKATATAALDNGLTAGAYFEVTVADDDAAAANDGGIALSSSDFVLSLTTEGAGLYFGDTKAAAETHWAAAGDMESDGFSNSSDAAVLRGDYTIGGFKTSLSYNIDDANNTVEQLSLGASGSFGAITVAAAYQAKVTSAFDADGTDGDFNNGTIYGISASGTFAGATVTAAYANDANDGAGDTGVATTSTGIKLSYPFGPVTATAYYVQESGGANTNPNYGVNVKYSANGITVTADYQNDQTTTIWQVDGSYDLGNGLTVIGGAEEQSGVSGASADYYVGAKYDLGGGASVVMTYADDADNSAGDEIGAGDYKDGVTVEVSFAF